jgi:hypothetical protein
VEKKWKVVFQSNSRILSEKKTKKQKNKKTKKKQKMIPK